MVQNANGDAITIRTEVDPKRLEHCFNKKNYKKHTDRQLEYVDDSISDHGWAGQPLYCANTDRLINGNGRVLKAIETNKKVIPIDIGWWTEDDGDELLATLDPTGQMASIDGNALSSLTERIIRRRMGDKTASKRLDAAKDIHTFANEIAEKRRNRLTIEKSKRSFKKILDERSEAKRDKRETFSDYEEEIYNKELKEDVHFPSSSNEYGIPNLQKKSLYKNAKKLPTSTFCRDGKILKPDWYYCQGSRPFDTNNSIKPEGGFLGFYCEDELYEKYFKFPAKWAEHLIDEQWSAVIEPDFSTYWDWPFAKRLWSVYKSRWLCRYWQRLGIKIIPIIRRTNDFKRDLWLYSSLPETTLAFMQLRMGGRKNIEDKQYWNGIAQVLDYMVNERGLKHICFYAGESYEKYVIGKLPPSLTYTMVEPFINKRIKHTKTK